MQESKPRYARRDAMKMMAGAAVATTLGVGTSQSVGAAPPKLNGNVNHSVCKWCYRRMSVAELAKESAAMGIASVELLGPKDWRMLKRHDVTCAMANGPTSIGHGWNEPELHDDFVKASEKMIPEVADAGLPNIIVFSGNRRALSDEEGLENCAAGLKRIMPLAETAGVTVCMELLNSKVDHKDYQCDLTPWGVELAKRVDSPRFKLLYDIYHMQIMEGDVIRTIQDNAEFIGHYHTGGVPGRAEIDETQELNYTAICKAIVETGFTGYIAQEFVPKLDPMTSLREAVGICDV